MLVFIYFLFVIIWYFVEFFCILMTKQSLIFGFFFLFSCWHVQLNKWTQVFFFYNNITRYVLLSQIFNLVIHIEQNIKLYFLICVAPASFKHHIHLIVFLYTVTLSTHNGVISFCLQWVTFYYYNCIWYFDRSKLNNRLRLLGT